MALAAVPSGLMLSTTTHITTDVMAMPLLWVIPLALYLLTFIIAFARTGALVRRIASATAPYIVYFLSCFVLVGGGTQLGTFTIQLALFFVAALGLHIALAAQQPSPAQLTEFYLWMSIGGVVGGLFCALLAPSVFDWTYEHLILALAAVALLPAPTIPSIVREWWESPRASLAMRYAMPAAFLGLAILAFMAESLNGSVIVALFMILMIAGVATIGKAGHAVWAVGMLMLVAGGWANLKLSAEPGARERSFFGVSTVLNNEDGTLRMLAHGTTVHGMQSLRPGHETDRLAYYAPQSGISMVMSSLAATTGPAARVGVVGLGAGTLACFAKPDQTWTAFEIDPTVVAIANDSKRFSFISRCKPDMRIVLGDARLTLSKEAPGKYDVLVADAFSSDSIPLHLMTAEAFDGYSRALNKDGILMVNITNRYLDMEPVLAALAARRGWSGWTRIYRPDPQALAQHATTSKWVMLTRSEVRARQVLKAVGSARGDWSRLKGRRDVGAWTDDFSSILPVIDLQR
jgi:spermidine synthase